VTIRREPHTVLQAIGRALVHAAYHAGQGLYVARLVRQGEWRYVTVPPGQSERFRAEGGKYLRPQGGTARPAPGRRDDGGGGG